MTDSNRCGMYYSDLEYSIIMEQVRRRAACRREFLIQRTNPQKHAEEAGFLFDPAIQRFYSMKVTRINDFKTSSFKNIVFGIGVVVPIITYGYLMWNERAAREAKIRCGELRYRDRLFKLQ